MNKQLTLNAISDVHLGCFEKENLPDFAFSPNLDVLILAGDIMDGVKPHYIDWVLNLNPNLPIIYTPGNHEYYGSRRDKAIRELKNAFENTNVQFLINETTSFNGYKFIVTDLWTDYLLRGDIVKSTNFARSRMNDFRKIKYKSPNGYRKLRPLDTVQWHTQAKAFIQTELDNCQDEIPILVSHHLTSPIQVEPEYQGSDYSPAYASDMHTFFNQCNTKPILAINGHSHFCNFTLDNQIYYFSNTYGYHNIDEKPEFDSRAKIVINGTKVDLIKSQRRL